MVTVRCTWSHVVFTSFRWTGTKSSVLPSGGVGRVEIELQIKLAAHSLARGCPDESLEGPHLLFERWLMLEYPKGLGHQAPSRELELKTPHGQFTNT